MSNIGIVVIGRNEGERLGRCLDSISGLGLPIIYVDSASTDGSCELARSRNVTVVSLDSSQPLTAARGRNAGFERLFHIAPDVEFVQFVDGDCEMMPGWFDCGAQELLQHPQVVAVCGILRERHPETSIYNRFCQMEWGANIGEIRACGGIAMYRAACLRAVGVFDGSIPAGEEPELCLRLRRRGWKIVRLRSDMAWHDAAITQFSQWWTRCVRSGYGALDVASRFERGSRDGVFQRQVRSARVWTAGWSLLILLAAIIAAIWSANLGLALGGGIFLLLPLQAGRIAIGAVRQGAGPGLASARGALIMVGKWAQLAGQVKYWRDQHTGHDPSLIEYKSPDATSAVISS